MGFLYVLTFANGKQYVGQTRRTVHLRMIGHKSCASQGRMNPVSCAWRKHGEPTVSSISEMPDATLDTAERSTIVALNTATPNGYNAESGGVEGKSPSFKTRALMSVKRKQRKTTAATKARISESMRKLPPKSIATREKLSLANKGKRRSPEHRAAMSARRKGKIFFVHTAESRARIGEANRKRHVKKAVVDTIARLPGLQLLDTTQRVASAPAADPLMAEPSVKLA
jgi:hypothetical protein